MLRTGKPNSQSAAASSANGARPTLRGGREGDCGRDVVGELATLHGRLTVANQQIQNIINSTNSDQKELKLSITEETEILIKAIRINILSKLTFADSKKFIYIIVNSRALL